MKIINNNLNLKAAITNFFQRLCNEPSTDVALLNTLKNIDVVDICFNRPPMIKFTETAYRKMMALVNASNQEIAWHGLVRKLQNPLVYEVYDIVCYPQHTTAATVESDDDNYPMWIMKQPEEVWNNIHLQGHSHVNMGVSPSGTDVENWTKLFDTVMADNTATFYIVMIINKAEKIYAKILDKELGVIFEDADVEWCIDERVNYTAWAAETIKENITPKKYNYGIKTHPSVMAGSTVYQQTFDGYEEEFIYGNKFENALSAAQNKLNKSNKSNKSNKTNKTNKK